MTVVTRRSLLVAAAGAAAVAAAPATALAGMPAFLLTDIARARLEVISFFLVVFLVAAGCIQRLWNFLARDFPALPRLDYRRALALVALWGLAFNLVLTMISGARELMTPGAWERVEGGSTYRLAADPPPERP